METQHVCVCVCVCVHTAAQKFGISKIFNVFLKKFLLLIKAVSI